MDQVMKLSIMYTVIDKATEPIRKLKNTLTNFEKIAQNGRGMQEWGTRLGMTAAVVSATSDKMNGYVSSLKQPYMEVEDALLALQTVTTSSYGDMQKSMQMTQKSAIEWSKKHRDSAAQYIQTTYQMASAGLNDVQAIAATETAMRTARATMGDSAEAAGLIAVAYNNMGDKSKDAQKEIGKLGDIITKTQQAFQIKNLNQLSEGLKYAIPTALQFGQSFEEINVAVGALNNAGLTGGQAGTAYAAAMGQMNKASSELGFEIARSASGGIDFIATLENINNTYGSFKDMAPEVQEAFKAAFGDEGLRTISLLAGKTADMRKQMDAVHGSLGAAAEAQGIMESSQSSKMQIAANKLNAVKINFAEKLVESGTVANTIIPKFADLVAWVGDMAIAFAEANPNLTAMIMFVFMLTAGILAIGAPLLMAVSGIVAFGGTCVSTYATIGDGIGRVRDTIRAADIGGQAKSISDAVGSGIGKARRTLVEGALAAKNFGLQMAAAGKAAAISAAGGIKKAVIGMANMARQAVITAVTALPGLIASTWAWTAALLANPVTWIVIALVAAIALCIYYWDDLKAAAISAWDWIVAAATDGVNAYLGIWQSLIDWVVNMGATFFNSGAALWDAFTQGIASKLSGPAEMVKAGLQYVRNMLPFSDAKEGPLSQLTKSGRAIMTTIASGVPQGYGLLQAAVATGFSGIELQPELPFTWPMADPMDPVDKNNGRREPKESILDRFSKKMDRRLAIYGDVNMKVNKMDDADSLVQTLRMIADQEGDDYED